MRMWISSISRRIDEMTNMLRVGSIGRKHTDKYCSQGLLADTKVTFPDTGKEKMSAVSPSLTKIE